MGVESLRQQTHLESHPKIKKRQETVACSMRVHTTWPSSWTIPWGRVTEWQLGNCTRQKPWEKGRLQNSRDIHYTLPFWWKIHLIFNLTSSFNSNKPRFPPHDPFAVLQAHLDICTVTLQHHSPSLLALELWNWRLFILGRQLVK